MPLRAFGKPPRALEWLKRASKSSKIIFHSDFGPKKRLLDPKNIQTLCTVFKFCGFATVSSSRLKRSSWELPKRLQDGFMTIQDAFKMAPMASTIAPKTNKDPSKRPPRAQDPPRSAQEVPKSPPRAPKSSPRAPSGTLQIPDCNA